MIVVTIPAYNEEKTIGNVINNIHNILSPTGWNYKVLVVDDGSNDNTAKIASESGAIVYSHPINFGLAATFRTEIEKCLKLGADIIVHIDADGQYNAKDIIPMIDEINKGYDLVLASRFLGTIEAMPFTKKLGNIAFSKVISHITNLKVSDCQTGFRAFTKELAMNLKIISNHTYTQEQIIRAVKNKYRIKEIPTHFAKRNGKSRLLNNPFEYALKAWINILRIYRDYEPLKFFGYIGFMFAAAGSAIGLWLVYRFITLGYVGHVPSIILSMLLIIVGIQIGLFGFFADMHKKE